LLQASDSPAHCRFTLEQPLDEATQLFHARLLHRCDPGIQLVTLTPADHAAEGLDLVTGACDHGIEAQEVREEDLITWTVLPRFRQKEAGRSESGQGGGTAFVLGLGIEGCRRRLATREPGACLTP
jgi:hypothetical protein